MSPTVWFICLVLAAAGLALVVHWRYRRPLLQLHQALAQMALPPGVPSREPTFGGDLGKNALYELHQLSNRIELMRRQISDESFNLRAILSSMVEGVLIVDGSQRIRLANEALHRLFSLQQSPIDRSIMEVFRNHGLQHAIRVALETQEPQTQELTIETFEHSSYLPKHFEVTAVALGSTTEAHPVGAIAVFHDITKVKELEAVRREFVANVSHELRTPLSIINGYVETLLDGALEDPEAAERFLRVMAKHGERLNLLIEDLLTLSKLESASTSPRLEWVELEQCVRRVLEQLERNLQQKCAKVDIQIAEDAAFVQVDEQRLEQALFNLIDNAIKYGVEGVLRITISAKTSGGSVELAVADNGPGIPMEDQPHIFERFYRVHKDRSRDAGGTGLGLSIVKHVMQLHNGSVAVQSRPGQGTTLILRLPHRLP